MRLILTQRCMKGRESVTVWKGVVFERKNLHLTGLLTKQRNSERRRWVLRDARNTISLLFIWWEKQAQFLNNALWGKAAGFCKFFLPPNMAQRVALGAISQNHGSGVSFILFLLLSHCFQTLLLTWEVDLREEEKNHGREETSFQKSISSPGVRNWNRKEPRDEKRELFREKKGDGYSVTTGCYDQMWQPLEQAHWTVSKSQGEREMSREKYWEKGKKAVNWWREWKRFTFSRLPLTRFRSVNHTQYVHMDMAINPRLSSLLLHSLLYFSSDSLLHFNNLKAEVLYSNKMR